MGSSMGKTVWDLKTRGSAGHQAARDSLISTSTNGSRGASARVGVQKVVVMSAPSQRLASPSQAPVRKAAPSKLNKTSDWIGQFTRAWSRGGTQTMELARLVSTARKRMCYGEWTGLWQSGEMPFSKRKGEMLIVIGERMGERDAQTIARLPTGWSVLYWLARLERETLKKLVGEGTVHPKLTLQEAKKLALKPRSRPAKSLSQKASITRRLNQFRNYVQRTLGDWRREDRELATKELARLIREIGGTDCEDAPGPEFPRQHLIATRPSLTRNSTDHSK